MRAIAIALALSACTSAQRRYVNPMALAVSTAALACDFGQTRQAAARGWEGQHEANPIMGPTPSQTTVGLYFASAAALNAVAWWLTPERWRSAAPTGVVVLQANVVGRNLDGKRLSPCGL